MPFNVVPDISNASPKVQAALTWGKALSTIDLKLLGDIITDDYQHTFLPASAGLPSSSGKEEYLKNMGQTLSLAQEFTVEVKEIVEGTDKVVFHTTAFAKTALGVDYNNEYIMIFGFRQSPDGTYKVSEVKDFVDSKFTVAYVEKIKEALAARQGERK